MSTPAESLKAKFADSIIATNEFRGETTLTVKPEDLVKVCEFCRDELGFDYLIDISSIDHLGEEPRFEVVYELQILESAKHLRLKLSISEDEPVVDSVLSVWPTADWHEREIFDMMGIRFANHPDLRRIIMWDGYPHHPLRKDFPLAGKPTDLPDVAFTDKAPLAGGPFVSSPTSGNTQVREPRARDAGDLPPKQSFIAEP